MSTFIVPMGSLPSISSINSIQGQQGSSRVSGAGGSFSDLLQQAISNLSQTDNTLQSDMMGMALGSTDDFHTGSIAAVKASAAVDFTSNLMSAAIRSYNELMRMQI